MTSGTALHASVLLVGPDAARLSQYAAALDGYPIREAASAGEALGQVAGGSAAAVVCESALESPRGGIELCRRVERLRGPSCPVLLIAQSGSEPEALLCFEAGAEDVFFPPVSAGLLRARVEALLRRAGRGGLRGGRVDEASMALLGQLVGGIAHDLSNPIAAVLSNLRSLQAYHRDLARALREVATPPELGPALEDLKPLVEECLAGGARIELLVNALREYSKKDAAEPASLDVSDALEGALLVAGHELGHGLVLERRYEARARALGWAVSLRRCFTHLVVTCARALAGKDRELCVATDSDDDLVFARLIARRGVDAAAVERSWRPYFEHSVVAEEASVSLAAADRIARAHAGELSWRCALPHEVSLVVALPADKG
jgi:DNA-binding response OmpR family regulator